MIIHNNKIIKATEDELYSEWLNFWSDFYPFDEYLRRMKDKGVVIEEAEND